MRPYARVFTAFLLIGATALAQGAKSPDLSKHPWAKWKPGSWVKYRQEGEHITVTLKAVTDKGYTLAALREKTGIAPQTTERAFAFHEDWPVGNPAATEIEKRKFGVDGAQFEVAGLQILASSKSPIGRQAWADPKTGLLLRYYELTASRKPPGNVEVQATTLAEEAEINGKKVKGARLEGTHVEVLRIGTRSSETKLPVTYVYSLDVPGGWVRRQETGGLTVVDFEALP